MKKLLLLLWAAVAFLATSCIEHHSTIRLNKDGSGTITEETVFGAKTLAMMEQMSAMGGEEAGDPLKDMVDEEKAKKQAGEMGEGVTVEKVEAINEGDRKGVRMVFAFKDINTVKYGFGDGMKNMGDDMGPGAGEEEKASEPMKFAYKDGVLTLKNEAAGKKADKPDEAPEEMDEQSLMMAQQMMGDMKMSLKIELPGGIEETNASHVDGNTVTFMDMDFSKLVSDPEKFKKFASAQPETPAEMQAALAGIEGVKVESKEEVTIKLK